MLCQGMVFVAPTVVAELKVTSFLHTWYRSKFVLPCR